MYLMADFARRVGSKDKKKRKSSNLFTSTLVGGGLMYGGYKLDEPGIRLPDKKPKFNRTTSGDPGLDLAFDFKNELIRRKKPEVNRRYFKLFGGKYKQLVDNTLYSPNPGRRQLAAIGTLVGAAYLGANAIKGGSYLINKARNKGKK